MRTLFHHLAALIGFLLVSFAHGANYTVEIQGYGGYSTALMLPIIDTRIANGPTIDYAFVMLGTNDSLSDYVRVSPDTFESNLRGIVLKLVNHGAHVFLAEIPAVIDPVVSARKQWLSTTPTTQVQLYNIRVRILAEEFAPSVTLVPTFDYFLPHAVLPEDWLIGSDGVHPTKKGARAIAELYAQFLPWPQAEEKRVVLFGDSLMNSATYGGAPFRPGDYLAEFLSVNAASEWLNYR